MIDRERIQFLTAVRWHLDYNFYPAMGYMFDSTVEALDNCNNYEPEKLVTVPDGRKLASSYIVDELRLQDMVTIEREEG